MYRIIAGIDTYESAPGYKKIKIQPHLGSGLTEAAADYQTDYGLLTSHWKSGENKQLKLDIEIPANTTATVYIPATEAKAVKENNKSLSSSAGIKISGKEKDYVVVEIGSGKYSFTSTMP
jgi:alpha-L-rhamnosidase